MSATDPRAFGEFYRRHAVGVERWLRTKTPDMTTAADLTAETFLAAVAACRREPPPTPSTGWLVGIARHKLVDHYRAGERKTRGLTAVAGPNIPDLTDPWDAPLDAL